MMVFREFDVEHFLTLEGLMKSMRHYLTPFLFVCLMGFVLSGTVRAGFIVWIENGSIFRANLDGSQKHQIFRASSSTGAATGLAYDSVTGLLYWDGRSEPSSVNVGRGFVRRMNLDGSGLEDVYHGWTSCFDLNSSDNKIYIGTNKDIRRVDFDGSNPKVLIPNAEHLISLQLDVSARTMYWMTNTHIDCANLDGSNPRPIIRLGATATLAKDDMIIITNPANPVRTPKDR
jgi:hypothetical protein